MKAARIHQHGNPSDIQIDDVEPPEPGPEDVLIDVRAAGLNHLDLWVLQGVPGVEGDFPQILGSDACGIVRETGAEVDSVRTGDRVVVNPGRSCDRCAMCRRGQQSQCDSFYLLGEHADGLFAERVALPASSLYPAPDHLSDAEAAAFPLVFVTAWRMLIERADLQPGERVLIHGIGGGVAGAALQIAEALGAVCLVTSSSDEKLDRAASLGTAEGIHYTDQDVAGTVLSWTDGRGVDVVVDTVGADTWAISQKCARSGGRIVTCGATSGPSPETNVNRIFWKQLSILGSTMGSYENFDRMLEWVCGSGVSPVMDRVFDFEEVQQAEQRLAGGEQFGKIVLDISS